jgi:hypothetical protein
VVIEHRTGNDGALLFPETGSNCAARYTATRGHIDEVFQNAEYICRQNFSCNDRRRCRWRRAASSPNGINRLAS